MPLDYVIRWSIEPSPARVTAALTGPSVRLTYRFEKRSLANGYIADVTEYITGGQLDGNNDRAVFATARFSILPESGINTLADHIAPICRLLVDGSYWYEDQVGLFALNASDKSYSPGLETWDVGANDLTIHLMERTLTAAHTVASGANYVSGTGGIRAVIDLAGLRHAIPATTLTLPADRTWPIGTPLLTVVNDLLHACNMYSCWATRDGTIISRTTDTLATRTPDAAYSGTDFVLSPIREQAEVTRFANQVVVISEDANSGLISSTATNSDPDSPTSTVTLGRTITKVIRRSVAGQTAADAIAASELQEASSLYRRATLSLQPDPRRWAHEVLSLEVDGVLASENWWVRSWQLPLKSGSRMSMTVAKVEKVEVAA